MAKLLITRDSVKFLNIYNKTYFIDSFNFINKKFALNLDYADLENLLLNIVPNTGKTDKIKFKENNKYLRIDKQISLNKDSIQTLEQSIFIDKKNTSFKRLSIISNDGEFSSGLLYDKFIEFQNLKFPTKLLFFVDANTKNIILSLDFDKIEFNTPVKSNLRITSRYKQIKDL